MEDAMEAVNEGKMDGERLFDDFSARCRDVCPCPQCGRIYMETEPRSAMFDVYVKEDRRQT